MFSRPKRNPVGQTGLCTDAGGYQRVRMGCWIISASGRGFNTGQLSTDQRKAEAFVISTMVDGLGPGPVVRQADTDGEPGTPLSNRGVAQAVQKPSFVFPLRSWVAVDRLVVEFWASGKLDEARDRVMGGLVGNPGVRAARRSGKSYVRSVSGLMAAAGDDEEGRPFVRISQHCDRAGSPSISGLLWRFEMNPAKVSVRPGVAAAVAATLRGLGACVDRMCVRGFHAAVDYGAPRDQFVLDSRRHKLVHFGVGPRGAESSYAGFKSEEQWVLYDKSREREAAGAEYPINRTRFEYRLLVPSDECLLSRLHLVRPSRLAVCCLRFMPFDPVNVADEAWALALRLLRASSIREVIAHARVRWSAERLRDFMACVCPPVEPSPVAVFRDKWPEAVRRDLAFMFEAVQSGGGLTPC